MIIIGRGEPPLWVFVPAPFVQRVRARAGLLGFVTIGAALVCGVAVVVLGLNNPTSYHPINKIGVMTGGIAAFWLLLSGLNLTAIRSLARGDHLDVNGARLTRRMLAVWWIGAIFCALLAFFAEVMTLGLDSRPVAFTVGSAVYLALLGVVVVLGGVAFFSARNLLGPPSPR